MKKALLILICSLFSLGIFAQDEEPTQNLTQAEYLSLNQDKTYLSDYYIPMDLDDAIGKLKELGDAKGLEKFKTATETIVRERITKTLGNWVRKNWGLEKGSRLVKYFVDHEISHPDDMVDILLISFHRNLLERPINLEEQIARRKELRKKIVEKQYLKGEERIVRPN